MNKTISLRELIPLYAIIFIAFLGYALIITLFVPIIINKNSLLIPLHTSLDMRATLSGLLLAMYPLGQFLGAPVIGTLSDHFGRKRVLLLSIIICSIGFLGIGISLKFNALSSVFLFSFLTGLAESNMAISQAIISDHTSSLEERTKLIGYAYSACSLGYIVGPLFAGLSSIIGIATPFYFVAVMSMSLFFWILHVLQDNKAINKESKPKLLLALSQMRKTIFQKRLVKYYLTNFIIFYAIQGLYRVVPLYADARWQPKLTTYSLLISFVSFICFLTNLFVLKRLSNKFSTEGLLSSLLLLGSITVIFILVPSQFSWIWLTFGLAVIPTVMALPTCTVWLASQAEVGTEGAVLGSNQSLLVFGEGSSAALGGLLAAVFIQLPIVVTGVMLVIAAGLVRFNHKRHTP